MQFSFTLALLASTVLAAPAAMYAAPASSSTPKPDAHRAHQRQHAHHHLLQHTRSHALVARASATPASTNNGNSGSYTVGGLGARKQAVTAAGGNDLSLAVAMLETDNMQSTYTYGDGKTQDSANFGIFKQNWGVLRQCCSMFQGQQQADWNNGAKLNQDLNADVGCLMQCQQKLGLNAWFGGHRDGSSGIQNPNTQTVQDYKTGVQWIQQQVDSQPAAKTDDTRFYYKVQAI